MSKGAYDQKPYMSLGVSVQGVHSRGGGGYVQDPVRTEDKKRPVLFPYCSRQVMAG